MTNYITFHEKVIDLKGVVVREKYRLQRGHNATLDPTRDRCSGPSFEDFLASYRTSKVHLMHESVDGAKILTIPSHYFMCGSHIKGHPPLDVLHILPLTKEEMEMLSVEVLKKLRGE